MSHAAVYETAADPVLYESPVEESLLDLSLRPRGRGGFLLASLAGAFVTTCLSGAALCYAFTHIPEVDPNAEAAPVAAAAAIAAETPDRPAKLQVLTPPVYGPEIISQAPAAPFERLSAQVSASTVDMSALAQADGTQPDATLADDGARPCADPCSARAGYAVPAYAAQPAPQPAARPVSDVSPRADTDDDGNAPPPPDMAVN